MTVGPPLGPPGLQVSCEKKTPGLPSSHLLFGCKISSKVRSMWQSPRALPSEMTPQVGRKEDDGNTNGITWGQGRAWVSTDAGGPQRGSGSGVRGWLILTGKWLKPMGKAIPSLQSYPCPLVRLEPKCNTTDEGAGVGAGNTQATGLSVLGASLSLRSVIPHTARREESVLS